MLVQILSCHTVPCIENYRTSSTVIPTWRLLGLVVMIAAFQAAERGSIPRVVNRWRPIGTQNIVLGAAVATVWFLKCD